MLTVIAALLATARAVDRELKKPTKQPTPEQADELERRALGYMRYEYVTPESRRARRR